MLKSLVRSLLRLHPSGRTLLAFEGHPLPGHYKSPIPSEAELRAREAQIWNLDRETLPGIDLDPQGQWAWLQQLLSPGKELPYAQTPTEGYRYWYKAPLFHTADGAMLYLVLRHLKPKRIIEVGSGSSSALMLDVNEHLHDGAMQLSFIEPNPERLFSLLRPGEQQQIRLERAWLQDVPLERFDELEAGDLLFLDGSHVSKAGSDVNWYLFEVLPRLKPGVLVHIHDIFYPFEVPKEWAFQKMYWNENHLLRAFLQYNSAFRIRFWQHWWYTFRQAELAQACPPLAHEYGGSLYLERV